MLAHILNKTITLGRYEVVKHLAHGGMAEVSLARATGIEGFERHVVIKRIRPDQARDKSHVQMFLEEARLAATLHHQNIVQVHDIGAEQGEYFFVMEYVHGEDVRRLLTETNQRGERIPLEHVLTIITAAAAGLHHAHEQCGPSCVPLGIVHRDVSPDNILVGYDGSVKVADFGIAKAAHRALETESGVLKGKVSYMSPEQCVGLEVDRRSDVFALGIVLYECITGRRLFKDDNDFLTMTAIVQSKIPPPSTVWPEIPAALEAIVMKALSLSPGDRYATADQMRLALEEFAAKIGLRASVTALADYMKARFGRRREPWLVDESDPEIEILLDPSRSSARSACDPKDAIATPAVPTGSTVELSASLMVVRDNPLPDRAMPADACSAPWAEQALVLARPVRAVRPPPRPSPVRRRWRWLATGAGAAVAIAVAIGLVTARSDELVAAPAILFPAGLSRGPSLAAPAAVSQPGLVPAAIGPVLGAALPPAAELLDSATDAPVAAEPARAQPSEKHHNKRSRPATAKKHWDPNTLFPK